MKQLWTGLTCSTMLVFAAALIGCSNSSAGSLEGAAPESLVVTALPSVSIISPAENAEWTDSELVIRVAVENFVLDSGSVGKEKVEGTGHMHIAVDGDVVGVSGESEIVLGGIEPGPHQIKVTLANNDHSRVGPTSEDSVFISVEHEVFDLSEHAKPTTVGKEEMSYDD